MLYGQCTNYTQLEFFWIKEVRLLCITEKYINESVHLINLLTGLFFDQVKLTNLSTVNAAHGLIYFHPFVCEWSFVTVSVNQLVLLNTEGFSNDELYTRIRRLTG